MFDKVHVVDSHTEGEPTRVVVEGGPKLRSKSLKERVEELRKEHDGFRSGVILEPRGSDAVVGALITEPTRRDADAAVIFFNNVGYLGMCGHGTIGLVETLRYLSRIKPGPLNIETPVGMVRAILHEKHRVSVFNVRSYRLHKDMKIDVPGHGEVVGDIGWGGNWFFMTSSHVPCLTLENLDKLTRYTLAIDRVLIDNGVTGADGGRIDHVELYGPPEVEGANSKNFVLCPGGAYDRSPCGTGTSAKMACLAADGKLAPGEVWRQESIIGTLFEGSYEQDGDGILPCITGRAFVTSEATLLFDPDDPLKAGIG